MGTDRYEDTISLWGDDSRRIVTLKNLQTGKTNTFTVRHSFTIGRNREACDLQISADDLYVSGVHLRFVNSRDGLYAEDMHSKNGTRINGRQMTSQTKVKRGDILRIGKSDYEILF